MAISNRVHQLDSLLKHSLWHDPVATGHRTLRMAKYETELIIKVSSAAKSSRKRDDLAQLSTPFLLWRTGPQEGTAMSRAKTTYRLVDLTRAVKAMQAVGLTIIQTQIAPDGTITLVHTGPGSALPELSPDYELAEWQTSRKRSAG